jgi:hypothetical protein
VQLHTLKKKRRRKGEEEKRRLFPVINIESLIYVASR